MEYVYSLPDDVYFHNNIEKGLLREGFKGELPDSIINKTKQSFMSPPINRFLDNKKFIVMIEEYILENKTLADLRLFDMDKLKELIYGGNREQMNLEPIIMTLLCTGIITKDLIA
jgi:asparagine synthase (glutamine-hydrolysing)